MYVFPTLIANLMLFFYYPLVTFVLFADAKMADDITNDDDLFDFDRNEEDEVRFSCFSVFVQCLKILSAY